MDDKNLSPEDAAKAVQTSDDWAMMALANKVVHLLVRCNADDCSTAIAVLLNSLYKSTTDDCHRNTIAIPR
jgi:hypothetical protein